MTDYVSTSRAAGILGVSVATVKRACLSGRIPARLGEGGAYEIVASDLDGIRASDVLSRPAHQGSRASVLAALDAVRRLCRALGADGPPRSVLSRARWDEAVGEAMRARTLLLVAAGLPPGSDAGEDHRDAREGPSQDHGSASEMQAR